MKLRKQNILNLKSKLQIMVLITALLFLVSTVIMTVLYRATAKGIFLTFAITCGTTAYHFWMRLLVGLLFHLVMKNKVDCTKRWYQVGKKEKAFYEKLKVKKWKNKMPTYYPEFFNPKIHTREEIMQAICEAELIHETIVVLSFVPILAGILFGAYPVFITTSILSAGFDFMLVMVQRYNRQRILKFQKANITKKNN